MESVICLSSCSVVLRYLVSSAGAIHGEFPLRLSYTMNPGADTYMHTSKPS